MATTILPMTSDIKFPPLQGNGDYAAWFKYLSQLLHKFGISGKAILTGIRNDPRYPKPDDMLLDADGIPTSIQLFEHAGDGTPLSPLTFINDGLSDYKKAITRFSKTKDAFNLGNDALSSCILLHLSPDVSKDLLSTASFVTALHKEITDTFDMVKIIQDLYGKGSGRTRVRQLKLFLSSQQGTSSHESYMEMIKQGVDTTLANYESSAFPGFISIDSLSSAIYLSGLDQEAFKFKLEASHIAHPDGQFTGLSSLMADYQIYARQHRDDSKTSLEYASALVATTSVPLHKCATCKAPVQINSRSGRPFPLCQPCYRDKMSKTKSPGPVVKKPTAADLLAARAMIAAHDVQVSLTPHISLDESDSD